MRPVFFRRRLDASIRDRNAGAEPQRESNAPVAMRDLRDARVGEVASRRKGLATTDDLRRAGLTDSAIARRVARGFYHPLFGGVFCIGHRSISRDAWFLGATMAVGDDSGLGFYSAVQHHDLWQGRVGEIHILVPRRARHRDRIHIHSVNHAPEWQEVRGVRVVAPALAVLQFAAVTPSLKEVRRVAREAQVLGLAEHAELLATCAPGARGAKRLRFALDGGPAATRNGGEDVVLDLIRSCGLDPLVNAPLLGFVADFYLPEYGLVVEFDGNVHKIPVVAADDRLRQNVFEVAGLRVLRLTWDDVTRNLDRTRRRLLAATVTRLPQSASSVAVGLGSGSGVTLA